MDDPQTDTQITPILNQQFKDIQEELRNAILVERTNETNAKFQKMIADKSRTTFWGHIKKINRNSANECLTVKNQQGRREYNPEGLKKHTLRTIKKETAVL